MNLKNNIFLSSLTAVILMSSNSVADVSGTVFRDLPVDGTSLNTYGLKDSNEVGIGGVVVTAYQTDGINTSTTTLEDGSWTLATTGAVRVEFSNWASYLQESSSGGVQNSSIQFLQNGGTSNFALHNPNDYVNNNVEILAVTISGGTRDANPDNPSLRKFTYSESSQNIDESGVSNIHTVSETGNVWGLAYSSTSKKAYTSASLRRHIDISPDGLGAIYVTDLTDSANPITSLFTTVPNVGSVPDAAARQLSSSSYASHDIVMGEVANVGLGDTDLSEDGKFLYTINLATQELVKIDIGTKVQSNHSIDNPFGATCPDGDIRSWGLEPHDGDVYIGSVCSTDVTVGSAVSKWDGSVYTTVLTTPLNYVRQKRLDWDADQPNDNWAPWLSDSTIIFNGTLTGSGREIGQPQPILSDIEFTEDNGMVLGYIDRLGLLTGYKNYAPDTTDGTLYQQDSGGDILRVCKVAGVYYNEGDANCLSHTNKDGNNEYFLGDVYDNSTARVHNETTLGGILYKQGSGHVVSTAYDPNNLHSSDGYNRSGITVFNMNTGDQTGGQLLNGLGTVVGPDFGLAKTGGMGDIELLSDPAPIEIGDRVWEDTNSNGIQDADEVGISNVTVELVCGGVVTSSATTDISGNYIFSNNPDKVSTGSHKYNLSALEAEVANCIVRVPNVTGVAKQTSLGILLLTTANLGEGANANSNDSDGETIGDNADVTILPTDVPLSGSNNHTFDFGFSSKPQMSIGSLVWEDNNNNGLQESDEVGIIDVNVTLLDSNGTVVAVPVQKTLVDGQYYFSGLDEGDYSVLVSVPAGKGYVPCTQQTTADNDDTENDSNIKEAQGQGYVSGMFTLEAGTEPAESNGKLGTDDADNANDENGNMTVDFCFYRPASLGDYVWYDDNNDGIQDVNESGVNGVSVKLLNNCDSADVLKTLITDIDGKYKFTNLNAGDYCVEFSNLPADYMVTTQGAGSANDSDASTTAPFRTATTTLDVGEEDLTWDMGIFSSTVAIGDRVWYDLNKDGQQDNGEVGVNGIEVKLLDGTCTNELNTTTTSGDGNYIFESLTAGTYCLEFGTLEAGYVISPQDSGDDTSDSDVNATTKKTIPVTLVEGARDLTWDMGIYKPATLGDKVWNDKNVNGIQDGDELPVAGVDVILLGSDCATAVSGVDPEITDENGNYLFTDLLAGDYCVEFRNIPTGYAITPQDRGDNGTDSDVNVTTGKTMLITLNAGDDDRTWDMGIYEEASIGNKVWNDINGNGIQDNTEIGVGNVKVTLFQSDCSTVAISNDGSSIASVNTDTNGLYIFEHLMPIEYCIGFSELPAGFGFTSQNNGDDTIDSDVNPVTGKTISTLLDAGEADMSWDAGIFQSASIGNKVWYDTNANGIQDNNESGVRDVSVKLYQSDCSTLAVDGLGNVIPFVVTDIDGFYNFIGLTPNSYCVGFDMTTLPVGSKVSPKKVTTTTEDKDSNADASGITESTELIGGENDTSWDMGIYSPVALGDRVWLDSNADGIQDANEIGVKDVTVTLYEADCTTVVGLNNDGSTIVPLLTDDNGKYLFTNLIPKEYCIGFSDLPAEYVVSPKDASTDNEDSDVNPDTLKTIPTLLESGENDLSWDMGIYQPASIGDRVWLDSNADGIQDINESGLENVAVTLYQSDCTSVVATDDSGVAITIQKTDSNGLYNFSNLTPNDYCIGFTIPEGYSISAQNQGDDNKDSDVDPDTFKTISTTLSSGENDTSWDAGVYKPVSIGDRVWNDTNGDGVQDTDEVGVKGVEVKLYGCDCETVALNQDGTAIAPVMTDANGVYNFTNLQPNKYCIGFTPLDGYVLSPQNNTEDDTADSDVNRDTNKTECITLSSDENDTTWDMGIYVPASIGDRVWYDTNRDGIQDVNETGVSNATVTLYTPSGVVVATTQTDEDGNFLFDALVPNNYQLEFEVPNGYALSDTNKTNDNNDSDVNPETKRTEIINLESGENDISWDAGIYKLSSLGDYVWYDENHNGIQDTDEPAVEDVKVTLYESDCTTAIAETRSDEEGKYLFENLEPNDYCVGFDELPIGYQFTPSYNNTGAGSELDCNVDPGTGKTPVITLPHATNDMTWDMGIIPKCADEEGRVLEVFNDEVTASTTGSVTTINILENDHGNLDIESIKFLSTTEGSILWENGTAVGGTSVETTDTLVVAGEGVWTVQVDGTVTFKAEAGFTGTPTPVYYVVKCKQGNISNVGQVKITSNCTCDTYEENISDAVPSLTFWSVLFMISSISLLGLLLVRHEFED